MGYIWLLSGMTKRCSVGRMRRVGVRCMGVDKCGCWGALYGSRLRHPRRRIGAVCDARRLCSLALVLVLQMLVRWHGASSVRACSWGDAIISSVGRSVISSSIFPEPGPSVHAAFVAMSRFGRTAFVWRLRRLVRHITNILVRTIVSVQSENLRADSRKQEIQSQLTQVVPKAKPDTRRKKETRARATVRKRNCKGSVSSTPNRSWLGPDQAYLARESFCHFSLTSGFALW
jgi:hypothetical protein